MKTIVLETPGQFREVQTAVPADPVAGEALVRVHQVGVCGTDYHAFRGRQPYFTYPRILGHEMAVEVVSISRSDAGLAVGDRCAVEPYLNCGQCGPCRRGKPNCCANLKVLGVHIDGGMRDYLTVPVAKLHRSSTLSFEQLALVEAQSIAAHAVDRATLERGENALVVGAGPIGLGVTQFALLAGASVIVLDVSETRLDFCRRQYPAAQCLLSTDNPVEVVMDALSGELPTAVFDATGNAQSMMAAFSYVASGGRLIFVGLVQADLTFHDPEFHRRELTLLSSRNSLGKNFDQIIAHMEEGRIDVTPWITHRMNSDALIETFPQWLEPDSGIIKGLVAF